MNFSVFCHGTKKFFPPPHLEVLWLAKWYTWIYFSLFRKGFSGWLWKRAFECVLFRSNFCQIHHEKSFLSVSKSSEITKNIWGRNAIKKFPLQKKTSIFIILSRKKNTEQVKNVQFKIGFPQGKKFHQTHKNLIRKKVSPFFLEISECFFAKINELRPFNCAPRKKASKALLFSRWCVALLTQLFFGLFPSLSTSTETKKNWAGRPTSCQSIKNQGFSLINSVSTLRVFVRIFNNQKCSCFPL